MSGDPLVSCIVGGVQRAGTTSLFSYLSQHPQLSPSARKETHFFDDETRVDWTDPDYASYHRFFGEQSKGLLRFEATPIYLFWTPALARIRAYNPDVKLIFIFRDPIDRALSHWSLSRERSIEDLPFAAAIRSGRARLNGIDPLARPWRDYSYVERGFYGSQVERLFQFFPRGQVLALRSIDLKDEMEATLGRVADFLGIDPFPRLRPEKRNSRSPHRASIGSKDVEYLARIFSPEVAKFASLTGLYVGDWPIVREYGHAGIA